MLTRLQVSGFKNLVDVDVRFGAFTCIAGANGVGKSNLFDAIRFLSALADMPLIEAARSVRDEGEKTTDVRSLFHRVGSYYTDTIKFEAEMIVPKTGVDDLGQTAKARITYLRYSLELAYRVDSLSPSLGALEIVHEELEHINRSEASRHLGFPHRPAWRDSAIMGRRQEPSFISTETTSSGRYIKLHQDGKRGRPVARLASTLPRTVLSATNAAESPTALLARREMQSWRLLQLEPSSLRKSDTFTAPTKLGNDGSHLAATLYRLGRAENVQGQAYAQVAGRLSQLINDVRQVSVDRDDRRELLTALVTSRDGTTHTARALSDGTLRFLALAVLEQDPEMSGTLCLEEPENGIHPARIPAMVTLLQDIAVDLEMPVSDDNPLRQVIVNTHAPLVVQNVPDDSLVYAELRETVRDGQHVERAVFSYLSDTWRERAAQDDEKPVTLASKGHLLNYLRTASVIPSISTPTQSANSRRVIERSDLQLLLFDPMEN